MPAGYSHPLNEKGKQGSGATGCSTISSSSSSYHNVIPRTDKPNNMREDSKGKKKKILNRKVA